ncbi:acetyl-CoA C-acyltransferase [Robbsia sp. KACC 23696]|uniref:thiolase family protein n=1 Tax=Robbsia sp. KACC 23696 TaxID=3149231 RepID=UPI00325B9BD1
MNDIDDPIVLAGWARSAVVPVDGAFGDLTPAALGAPVILAALAKAGIVGAQVDTVVAGNALGANGNPARMLALAAGLPDACAAFSLDSQCCAGLDAVTVGAGLIASGTASIVVAGGVEAWSRAPIRAHRPARSDDPHEPPRVYERPAFAPDPARDPDLFAAAADYARQRRWTREAQDRYAIAMHGRARAHAAECANEIVRIAGIDADRYPRTLTAERAARMPLAMRADGLGHGLGLSPSDRIVDIDADDPRYAQSRIAVSPRADGAAFVVLMRASTHHTVRAHLAQTNAPRLIWRGGQSLGGKPEQPMLAAGLAANALLQRHGLSAQALHTIELHDAFASQAFAFAEQLGIDVMQLNRRGGGIARGHPIGASGAIALVRMATDLLRDGKTGDLGLAAIAGAGGLGAAALLARDDAVL